MSKKPAMHPDVSVGAALQAVARDILAEARNALEGRAKSDAVAVHDYRKAMKRWRALLRLLAPFLGDMGERLRVEARDLARALAGARDAQAAIDALDDLGENDDALSARSTATIRGRLEDIRRDAETSSLTAEMRTRLSDALDHADAAVALWPVEQIDFADIAARLAKTYRQVRSNMPDDWVAAEAEILHDMRRRVVAHRYQMELVEPLWPKLGKVWVAEAQRLRERLGAYQDLSVLTGFTAPHQPLAHWRSRLAPLIAARKAVHAKRAAHIAGRLFAERPKAFRRRLEALWASRSGK
jgi:CHAD domain-containing protein